MANLDCDVGCDIYIVVSALCIVYWSLLKAENFLGGLYSKSYLSVIPEEVHSCASLDSFRRLVTRYYKFIGGTSIHNIFVEIKKKTTSSAPSQISLRTDQV